MSITGFLALYGAVAATASALWNVHQFRSDRRLLVKAFVGHKPQTPQEIFMLIRIVNSGRRPMRLQGIKIHKNWRTSIRSSKLQLMQIIPEKWPRILNEGETCEVEVANPLLSELISREYRYLVVYDSTNKRWNISYRNVHKIYKTFKQIKAGGGVASSA